MDGQLRKARPKTNIANLKGGNYGMDNADSAGILSRRTV